MSAAAATAATFAPHVGIGRRVVREIRDLFAFRHLVAHLVATSLRTEASGTALGFLWWMLDPLMLMGVYTVFVGVILGRGTAHYPLFVLTAIIAWEFFAKSVTRSMTLTLAKEGSMRQVAFPRSAVPLAATLTEAIHFAFALGVLLALTPFFGLEPGPFALLAIPLGLVELVFTLGVSYLLASANVFFRDVKHLSEHGFWLWFHISPALFAATLIPLRYRAMFEANPFATFFEDLRSVLMYDRMPATSLVHLSVLCGASLAVLALGFICFVQCGRSFAKVA